MEILITCFAFILRLPFLNQSLWLDEAIEALAVMGRQGPLLTYALADYQPPLYHFVAYGLTHLFGYSEFVLRLPSLVAGVLTVWFVIKIGEILGNRRVGHIAGVLAATNPLLVYYSQEGRTYALTAFLATASFYFLLRLFQEPAITNRRLAIGYVLLSACMVWTSYLSWFLLLALAIYTLTRKRYDIFYLQVLAAFTLVLWLPSFLGSLRVGQYTLSTSDAWGRVVGGLTWKSLPLTWVKFMIGRISFRSPVAYAFIVICAGLAQLSLIRGALTRRLAPVWIWLTIPVACGIVTAVFLPVFSYFRVLFVLPAYLAILSIGIDGSKEPVKSVTYLAGFQMACLIFFWTHAAFHREDWRSLAHDLASDTSVRIAMPSRDQDPGLLYYGTDINRIFEPAREPISGNKIIYVRYAEDLFDRMRRGQANLGAAGYTVTVQRVYTGIAVDTYEKK